MSRYRKILYSIALILILVSVTFAARFTWWYLMGSLFPRLVAEDYIAANLPYPLAGIISLILTIWAGYKVTEPTKKPRPIKNIFKIN